MAKKTADVRSGKREPSPAFWEEIHKKYVSTLHTEGAVREWIEERALLRDLAKRYGCPLQELDKVAFLASWELERKAAAAYAWRDKFGKGARTEEDFVRIDAKESFWHLQAKSPEGAALAAALARDNWRRVMSDAAIWEAHVELEQARRVCDVLDEAWNKLRREGVKIPECRSF